MLTVALSLFLSVKITETQTVMRLRVERCQATSQLPPRLILRGRVIADRGVTFHATSGRLTKTKWRTISHPAQQVFYLDDAVQSCPKGTIEVTAVPCGSDPEQRCGEDLSKVVTTAPPFEKQKARR